MISKGRVLNNNGSSEDSILNLKASLCEKTREIMFGKLSQYFTFSGGRLYFQTWLKGRYEARLNFNIFLEVLLSFSLGS